MLGLVDYGSSDDEERADTGTVSSPAIVPQAHTNKQQATHTIGGSTSIISIPKCKMTKMDDSVKKRSRENDESLEEMPLKFFERRDFNLADNGSRDIVDSKSVVINAAPISLKQKTVSDYHEFIRLYGLNEVRIVQNYMVDITLEFTLYYREVQISRGPNQLKIKQYREATQR